MDVPYQTCSRCLKKGEIQCSLCNFAFYCSRECLDKDKRRHFVQCKHAQRVQQCANCKKQKPNLKYCSQCFYVFYCDSQCQKKNWDTHKTLCKKISSEISDCTIGEVEAPREVFSLYLGQSICHDYLNLNNNEGLEFQRDLHILMAGSGDIKNVVKTVTSLPKKFDRKVCFVLNDLNTHSVARNILFLYLTIADPNPEHMVQIWYSTQISSACFSYLKRNLMKLATKSLETILADMRGLVQLSEDHWNKCLKVWNGWQNLANKNDLHVNMRNIFALYRKRGVIQERSIPNKCLTEGVRDIAENGLLLPSKSDKRGQANYCNITLFSFNPAKSKDFQELKYLELSFIQFLQCPVLGEMIYGAGLLPFMLPCWPWSEVKKENSGDVLAAYESFIRKQFCTFSTRVKKGLINFHFIIDTFKHVRYYLQEPISFDRICVGHLGDVYLYPRLLQEFADLLNKRNPNAVLLTHHNHWFLAVHATYVIGLMDVETAEAFKEADRLASEDNFNLPFSLPSYRRTLATSNYFDIWPHFFRHLQKQAFAYIAEETHEIKVIHPGQMAKKFNLRLRNFHCEQNKVIPCWMSEENRIGPQTFTLEWIVNPKMRKL